MTRIDVTQEDINHGRRRDCQLCPVALAIQRVFPGKSIYVENYCVVITGPNILGRCVFKLPPGAVDFINNFDAWQPVKPISFDLNR